MQSKKENWTTRDPNHSTFFFLRLFSVYFDHNVLFFWLFFLTQRASLWTQSHFAISSLDFETAFYKSLSNTWLSRVMPGNWVCIFARDRLAFFTSICSYSSKKSSCLSREMMTDRPTMKKVCTGKYKTERMEAMHEDQQHESQHNRLGNINLSGHVLSYPEKERTCQV